MASDQGQAQAHRRENTTTEREIHYVEKERVPNLASHFESLVDSARDSEIITGGRVGSTPHQQNRANTVGYASGAGRARETHGVGATATGIDRRPNVSAVGKFEFENRSEGQNRGNQQGSGRSRNVSQFSSDKLGIGDISQLRGQAQQQSMEAINAAEQRYNYNKARESAIEGLNAASEQAKQARDTENQGARASATQAHDRAHTNRGAEGKETTQQHTSQFSSGGQTAQQHKKTQNQGARAVGTYGHGTTQAHDLGHTGRGAQAKETSQQQKDTGNQAKTGAQYIENQGTQAKEGAQYAGAFNSASEFAKEKGSQAKDTIVQGTQYATEKGVQAKDTVVEGAQRASQYIAEKTGGATESLTSAGKISMGYTQQATNYTWEKAVGAKDTLVDVGKNVASYTGEKMVAAKDVTGKVAAGVADRVPAAGWTAAHYTTEKAVEGTKMAAQVVQGAGQKVVEVAAKPLLNVAKDVAASTGETLKEYTARKKEEAQRELEARKSAEQYEQQGMESRGEQGGSRESSQQPREANVGSLTSVEAQKPWNRSMEREVAAGEIMRNVDFENQMRPTEPNLDIQSGVEFQGQEGGVLGAIGETIVEIAQTTKNLVIGPDEDQDRANYGSTQMQGEGGNRK